METKKEKKYLHDMVNERIRQLMFHDRLVRDFKRRLKQLYDSNPHLKQGFHFLEFPSDMQKVRNQVDKKWNVRLIEWEQYGAGVYLTQKILPQIKELKPSHWKPVKGAVSYLKEKELEHLYLDIDLTTLDMNDAKQVKQQVWQMVKDRLIKRSIEDSRPTGMKQSHYKDDRPELAFIYHIKEETFQKYLWWYDVHQEEKFSFRLIALIDEERKQNQLKAEELLERLRSKRTKLGIPVKGEDAVEKGIKLIHKAIHGVDYYVKHTEPLNEEYNCPRHGKKCPLDCNYIRSWMDRFDRSMKKEPSRTGRGQTDAELDAMAYPKVRGKRGKPTN